MKWKIATIFVMTLMIAPILIATASENENPSTPVIEGPNEGEMGIVYTYTVTSTDPQQDDLYYDFGFSDDPTLIIRDGPFKSGEKVTFSHCWDDFYQVSGPFIIQVRAIDEQDHKSGWGEFEVNMTNVKVDVVEINKYNSNLLINNLILQFFENHPRMFPLLRQLLNI